MATVVFSSEMQHHVSCPPRTVFGQTVKEILESYFEPQMLNEQGLTRIFGRIFDALVPRNP